MQLHQKIVAERKKKGLTQEQMAELTKVTVRTIQRIESGENIPRSYTLKAIATALGISFEELKAGLNDSEPVTSEAISPAGNSTDEKQYFLQMLCLSCFSYLVIPWVHFLVPSYLLKRADEQDRGVMAFGRQLIKRQVYWVVAVHLLLLLSLAYNLILVKHFQKFPPIDYLWPVGLMYVVNAVMILLTIAQIKKVFPSTR